MPNRRANVPTPEIERHLDKLFRSAYRLTQNRADAEELVQDTCLRAVAKREDWGKASSPLAWLMRVQYNLFVDAARKRARGNVVALGDADHSAWAAGDRFDPELRTEEALRLARVQRAWKKLKTEQRALLTLRAEGFTLAEMGEISALTVEVINARLQRARQSLSRHLDEDDAAQAARQAEARR
jgi:RNA polymerase sigma-70 factor, ECF subfamily